ncbi:MAG: glycosyltransferase family 2 protein [Chloroflexi bacterium]|nr:glycosyltransferase family 2 protein [Chloroflexota bacterium]
MDSITFAVITKNEERNVADCLAQGTWADEILVLDSGSVDRTVEIARQFTSAVYQHPFRSFPHQRNAALRLATSDWVLFVDADERVTPELRQEIQSLLANRTAEETGEAPPLGYWIPRRNIIWGKWIRRGGWYPDYQLRLLRREGATYDEAREVHELVKLAGPAGHLQHPFVHFNYDTVSQFIAKQRAYSSFDARMLHASGQRAKWRSFVLQPLRAIKRRYWDLQGYRDGGHGLLLAVLLACYEVVVYWRLRRLDGA